jgi:hypothetical protein
MADYFREMQLRSGKEIGYKKGISQEKPEGSKSPWKCGNADLQIADESEKSSIRGQKPTEEEFLHYEMMAAGAQYITTEQSNYHLPPLFTVGRIRKVSTAGRVPKASWIARVHDDPGGRLSTSSR